ncbi:MAG: hypothetical protein KDK97_19210 [Verrucomicrobiales bacterium]|nr:hypothetical protein [Verrucomicrobiales bacterium]
MMTPDSMNDRQRELLTLAALGELSPDDAAEWESLLKAYPKVTECVADYRRIAAALAAQSSEMPESVRQQLDQARHAGGRKPAPHWRRLSAIVLPLAAAITLAFALLHQPEPVADQGIKQGPVVFATQAVRILAPGSETRLLQPTVVWKGTPGRTYDVRLVGDAGQILASAEGVQSPWLVELALQAGAEYQIQLAESGNASASPIGLRFVVHSQAAPLAADLQAQMQALAAAGHPQDALMLLYRLPEDALSSDQFADWRKRLSP